MAGSNEERPPDSQTIPAEHDRGAESAIGPQAVLHAAVERLYEVFAPYCRPSDFVGCPCGTCVSEAENAAIHARPLRDLSANDLAPASSLSIDTTDLKHLLPRIAELVAAGHR